MAIFMGCLGVLNPGIFPFGQFVHVSDVARDLRVGRGAEPTGQKGRAAARLEALE
jgi:hypothetical protein